MSRPLRHRLLLAILVGLAANIAAAPTPAPGAAASEPNLSKKRAEPAKVAPVTIGKVRYEVVPWGKDRGFKQDSGIIRALHVGTGSEVWLLKLYDIKIDPDMELDKQEDFIVQLKVVSGTLLVKTERGNRYRVDLSTRAVMPEPMAKTP